MTSQSAPGPRLSPDAPLFIVINAGSGRADTDAACTTIADVLGGASRRYQLLRVDDPDLLPATIANAVRAARAQDGVVVAAGGDGTLSAVASEAIAHRLPYAALPQGTFNLFGREHGLPQDIGAATRALLRARLEPVQVGRVNGRVFLVNASLGLYPQVLEDREAFKAEHGRSRFGAIWSGLKSLMRAPEQLRLDIESQDLRRSVRTPTLFVGNNALQLRRIGIDQPPGEGRLTGVMVKPIGTAAMFLLALRGALGRLGDGGNVVSFPFRRLTVAPRGRRRAKVAIDGEVLWLATPLVFDVSPDPLWLLRPAPEDRAEVA